MNNDQIIKRMYDWYLQDDVPSYCVNALLFYPSTFTPSSEQIAYVMERLNVPSNLRDVLKNDKKSLIFAIMKHFQISRTKAWEMCELFLSDYFSEKPQFMPKKLQESKRLWKEDVLKFWKDFDGSL